MPNSGRVRRLGVSAPSRFAERVRELLKKGGYLEYSLQVLKREDRVVFPLKLDANFSLEIIPPELGTVVVEEEFHERPLAPRSIREALSGVVSPIYLKKLPSSYDIVGDIAVVHIPKGLETIMRLIGDAIMLVNPSVKVVLAEAGPVSGVYRTRGLRHLAGERRTMTTHRENGCIFVVDLERVYFSPRLAGERMRIAKLTGSDEVVADMFAGVGPFSITIAKHAGARVFASEINADAYNLLLRNIEINKVADRVTPFHEDCRTVFTGNQIKVDRIVMNYPSDPFSFLNTALEILKIGGTIHLYGFAEDPEDWRLKIQERVSNLGASCEARVKRLKPISPTRGLLVADIKVHAR